MLQKIILLTVLAVSVSNVNSQTSAASSKQLARDHGDNRGTEGAGSLKDGADVRKQP